MPNCLKAAQSNDHKCEIRLATGSDSRALAFHMQGTRIDAWMPGLYSLSPIVFPLFLPELQPRTLSRQSTN